jgi:hypothetical protein
MDTLKTLRDDVLAKLDESGDASTTKTNVDNALNEANQRRAGAFDWSWMLWPQAEIITLSSGVQTYSLHQEVDRVLYLYNRTSKTYLKSVPFREIDPFGPNLLDASNGDKFHFMGMSPVQNQPTSSSVITIVSSSASDTGAGDAVTVTGETTSGLQSETISPNGTTPAAGSVAFTRITSVTLTAAWTGTLTMTSNSGAVTNLVLNPGELARQFPQIFLTWTPAGGEVLEYKFFRKPKILTADNAVPDVPFPYSKILVFDALLDLAAYNGQMDASRVRHWERKIDEIEKQLFMNSDPTIIGARTRSVHVTEPFDE